MSNYEIEIKSLLGSKDKADEFRKKIAGKIVDLSSVKKNKQLNHYFIYSNLDNFYKNLLPHIIEDKRLDFVKMITNGKDFSIRTREVDDKVILVVKASLDDDSSANGVSRMEFESLVGISLNDLDQLILDSDLKYQAKWSREREEYSLGDDISLCLDKNAGYGYLAEFEKVANDQNKIVEAKSELISLMNELDVYELKQDRLERMFSYYNNHWQDYYGTDKVFNIK